MQRKFPISLTIYCTCSGHFGYKWAVKHTVNHLNKVFPLGDFSSRVGHIKLKDTVEDKDVFEEIDSFFQIIALKLYTPWQGGIEKETITDKRIIKI